MYLSLGIIAYLFFMAYWWGNQGFFSALLHLMAAIAAGALALALWEPLTVNFFFAGKFSQYAWTVGLLGPFILLFLIIRITLDLTVRKNLYFNQFVNWLAGGICGLLAGIVISGVFIIGAGFLPLPHFMGYEPFTVDNNGAVIGEVGETSWWPVNKQAAGVFTLLSGGSFSSGNAMSTYRPDLAGQSARHRMRYDPNSSLVAAPQEVEIAQTGAALTPVGGVNEAILSILGPPARIPGSMLITVTTRLKGTGKGTFDSDGALRLPPTQIRLVTVPASDPEGPGKLHAPITYTRVDDATGARVLVPINDAKGAAWGRSSPTDLTWTFLVPADRRARFILVRHTRFDLGQVQVDLRNAIKDLGNPPGAAPAPPGLVGAPGTPGTTEPPTVGGLAGPKTKTIARGIGISNRLPVELSKNVAGNLECEGTAVRSGRADVPQVQGSLTEGVRIDSVWVPKFALAVRVEVDRDAAQSVLGAARVAAASLGGLWLKDSNGREHLPIAYAWRKKDNVTRVHVKDDYNDPFKSAREFPVDEMAVGESILIYFSVPKGTNIVEFRMGKDSFQRIDPPLIVPADK